MTKHVHLVVRADDNGAVAVVRDGLTRAEAERLAADLARGGHRQSYEAHAYAGAEERAELLARLRGEKNG